MMDVESEGVQPSSEPENALVLELRRRMLTAKPSDSDTRRQHAICVRQACKEYGSKSNRQVIFDGLNMTVPKGVIYGLLGASGCGKTTLLTCILGRRKLNSGEIWVLGGRPGSIGSGVPGPRVGYMPQEVALNGSFTIRETLKYFGWLYGMKMEDVEERTEFLYKLLQLPKTCHYVRNMSGGQQRRMSLAVALLNRPELLILDEPTAGVDPLLRQSLWNHFVEITRNQSTTVIITTHYIEETRQAHMIGLMRGGKFLAEESPIELMRKYQADSLEDVFLKLSVLQSMGRRRRSSIAQEVVQQLRLSGFGGTIQEQSPLDEPWEISGEFGDNIFNRRRRLRHEPSLTEPDFLQNDKRKPTLLFKKNHIKALIWKNLLWMWRNFGMLVFAIGLPLLNVILFCTAIGSDPNGLKVAVANNELTTDYIYNQECPLYEGCNYSYLSCRYLEFLANKSISLIYFDDEQKAHKYVVSGKAWGMITFASNFSQALEQRFELGSSVDDWDVNASDVPIMLDMTDLRLGTVLQKKIVDAFSEFAATFMQECKYNPSVVEIPVRMKTPMYGVHKADFRDFNAPGAVTIIIYLMGVGLTAAIMIIEKNEGILERSLVSGITTAEILFSHLFSQFLVVLAVSISSTLIAYKLFGLSNHGGMLTVILVLVVIGFCGMCFGLLVSCAFQNEGAALYASLGSFVPLVTTSGIIWPIEGIYPLLRYVSLLIPVTQTVTALRNVTQRGWTLAYHSVYLGLISPVIWTILFLGASIILFKFKKG